MFPKGKNNEKGTNLPLFVLVRSGTVRSASSVRPGSVPKKKEKRTLITFFKVKKSKRKRKRTNIPPFVQVPFVRDRPFVQVPFLNKKSFFLKKIIKKKDWLDKSISWSESDQIRSGFVCGMIRSDPHPFESVFFDSDQIFGSKICDLIRSVSNQIRGSESDRIFFGTLTRCSSSYCIRVKDG